MAEREIKLRGDQFVKAQAQRADMPHRRQALSATCHGALERNGEKAWRWYWISMREALNNINLAT